MAFGVGIDFWGDCACSVLEGDQSIWNEEDTNPRALFKAAWEFVEAEWAKNPRPLSIKVSIGDRYNEGSVLVCKTAANGRGHRQRCECPTCGWEDAQLYIRQIVLDDSFGLLFESPIEWLTADGPHRIFATWREVECSMCPMLDKAGLDRVTKKPLPTAGLPF